MKIDKVIEKEDEVEFFQIRIPKDSISQRVDKFLSSYSGYSRSRISNYTYKLLINKKEEKLSKIVKPDDLVEIYLKIPEDYTEIIPQKYDLNIIYEDDWFLLIRKPFNIPTHPSIGHPSNTILNYVKYYLIDNGVVPLPDCGMVHRLDKDTEGLLIFGKTIEAQAYLKSLFMERKIEKKYLAILNGKIKLENSEFTDKLSRDPNNRLKYKVSQKGKDAILAYKLIAENDDFSIVDITLKTGRTHQIRVQFSSRGHFIIGDILYGKKQNTNYENYGMLLISKKLGFLNPLNGKYMEFEIELSDRFYNFMKDNGINKI